MDMSLASVVDMDKSPMLIVGMFLSVLLLSHTLPRRCSVNKDKALSLPGHGHIRNFSSYLAQPLYFCPTYSQTDFLCLILNLFNGIPESYQVLRCQATTTEEELGLFLKRVERHKDHYLMLDVNRLPFNLQEVHWVQHCSPVITSMLYVCLAFGASASGHAAGPVPAGRLHGGRLLHHPLCGNSSLHAQGDAMDTAQGHKGQCVSGRGRGCGF